MAGPIVRFLASEDLLTSNLATQILVAVLHGLQIHGQHEGNQVNIELHIHTIDSSINQSISFVFFKQATLITLGVQVYEILRPKFQHIVEIVQQIPNTNIADIQKLDEKISSGGTKGNKIDKYKKDLFKKITAPVNMPF